MPELRKDPLVDRSVLIAPERARRPHDFSAATSRRSTNTCQFCEGHEYRTPGETFAFRPNESASDSPGWQVRIVPNKYPALSSPLDAEVVSDNDKSREPAFGIHEVVVESPEHVESLSQLAVDQVKQVFRAYRDRLLQLKTDSRWTYGLVFKNVGEAGGASIEHAHSQLVALPNTPPVVQMELDGSARYFKEHGRSFWQQLVDRALGTRERLAIETPHHVAVCPFAARFPFETWVVPKQSATHFEMTDDEHLADVAVLVRDVICRFEQILDCPAYNFLIHSTPFSMGTDTAYRWHIEIFPRLAKLAGFEWATGCYINAIPPELAAEKLRDIGTDLYRV
jgi:UDPglucose--hexose-1-phosphate uridylyltransferase